MPTKLLILIRRLQSVDKRRFPLLRKEGVQGVVGALQSDPTPSLISPFIRGRKIYQSSTLI